MKDEKDPKDIHDTDEPTKKPTSPYDGPDTADDPEGGQTQGSGGNPPTDPPPQGGGH